VTLQPPPFGELDGLSVKGGCEFCDADMSIGITDEGMTNITIQHDDDCKMLSDGPWSQAVIGDTDVIESALINVIPDNRETRRAKSRVSKNTKGQQA
jgi:hypothetical protein